MHSLTQNFPVITFNRIAKTEFCIHSIIMFLGKPVCFAFETLKTPLLPGRYLASYVMSTEFGIELIRLVVQGHEGIEIHPANYARQLRGCIAPITSLSIGGGWDSRKAMRKLYDTVGMPPLLYIDVVECYSTQD